MSWFKLSDGAAFHRKVLKAGNEAFGAWARAGAWSSAPDNLTDGYIPPEVCANIAPPKVWAKLRAAGLSEPPSDGRPGEQIHDFLAYNPSADQVKRDRDATRRRVDSWRDKRRSDESGNGPCNGVTNGVGTPAPSRPVPSRPSDPDPPLVPPEGGHAEQAVLPGHDSEPKRAKSERKQPAKAMPPDWSPNEGHYQRGTQLGLDARKVGEEADRFRDFHAAKGSVFVSWDAAFRTWLGNVNRFAGTSGPPRAANVQPVPASGRVWKSLPEV